MKKLWLILFISFVSLAQNTFTLTDPVIVNDNEELGLDRPRIVVDNSGNPIVMWTSWSNNEIYISRSEQGIFLPPDLISPPYFEFMAGDQYGPEIDGNGNFIFLSMNNNQNGIKNVYTIYSGDGGINFSDTIKIAEEEGLIEGTTVYVYRDNNNYIMPIISYLVLPSFGEANHVVNFGSFIDSEPGVSFFDPIIANQKTEGDPCECCNGAITLNEDNIIFMYRNNINNQRDMYACKLNNNTPWEEGSEFQIGFLTDLTEQYLSICPTEGPHGRIKNNKLINVFKSYSYSPAQISMSITDLNTQTVLVQDVIDWEEGFGSQSKPEIAVTDDFMAIIWREFRNYNLDYFISFKPLDDLTQINTSESISISNHEDFDFLMADIVSYDNDFHIVYLDQSNDVIYYRKAVLSNESYISEIEPLNNHLVKTIDILGKETKQNGFNIEIYYNGNVKKKYILD